MRYHGLGLIPWSPLGGGLLGGVLHKLEAAGHRPSLRIRNQIEQLRPRLQPYEALCTGLGEQPANVAVAWLLHNPAVTAAITGPRSVEHLDSSLQVPDIALADETLDALDEIWPGPGGEAPEAYAW